RGPKREPPMKGEPSSVGTPMTAIMASRFARSVQIGERRNDGMPTNGNFRLTSAAGSFAGFSTGVCSAGKRRLGAQKRGGFKVAGRLPPMYADNHDRMRPIARQQADQQGASVAGNLDLVDTIVILILENRSFDHMLGYLSKGADGLRVDGIRDDPTWLA